MMRFLACLLALVIAVPVAAQDSLSDPQAETLPPVTTPPANPVVAGQRQSLEQTAREAGIKPMARIGNRIENRIQSRINNRLERSYRPSTSGTAPHITAGEQVRRPTQGTRR
ncbi:hypothetical protein [Sphingomonas sp. GM_Shp_2]|uniref:hypothetical protein n=1 Tax=Sphingomonas sp. GM_Shp_2 TaxID=2937380 RepID=UPI00226A0BA2|nr:hypothetical protein [Sphingomonas sp. GM_Shp_2]